VPPPVYFWGSSGFAAPSPPKPNVIVTGLVASANLIVDSAGVVQDAVQLKTADGYVAIDIAKGTALLDADGQALKSITARALQSPPVPTSTTAMLFAYGFEPSPVQFKQPIILTFRYDPQTVPAIVDVSDLYIGVWDGNKWQSLDSTIDRATHAVSVHISGFSEYALLAKLPPPPPPPASFTFTEFSITPSPAQIGEAVNISVTCANIGRGPGLTSILLDVNGVGESSTVAFIAPGASQTVLFTVRRDVPGTYAVDVNGLEGQFTVIPQAQPEPTVPPQPVSTATVAPVAPKPAGLFTSWLPAYVGLFAVVAFLIGITFGARSKRPQEN
jgi:hypothetical protein